MVPEEASYMNFRDHPSMDYTAQHFVWVKNNYCVKFLWRPNLIYRHLIKTL